MKERAHGMRLLGLSMLETIWVIETNSAAGALPACVRSQNADTGREGKK